MTTMQVRGIEKRYGGVHALRGVDFDLRRGEVHALLGENGAGKSTLIKIISGLVQPNGGTIEVDGAPITLRSAAAAHMLGIQTVHQELELAGPLTVAENIFMGRLPTKHGVISRGVIRRTPRAGADRGRHRSGRHRLDALGQRSAGRRDCSGDHS